MYATIDGILVHIHAPPVTHHAAVVEGESLPVIADGTLLYAAPPAPAHEAMERIIAGALFDLMGYLTCREERLTLSSRDDAAPAVEVLTAWAKLRGLSLDDARVQDWRDALAARGEEPQRVQCPQCRGSGVGEYVYHGHGPDSIEPIRCDKCDGFGWLAAPPALPAEAREAMERAMAALWNERAVRRGCDGTIVCDTLTLPAINALRAALEK
jgi:hypothetical protein